MSGSPRTSSPRSSAPNSVRDEVGLASCKDRLPQQNLPGEIPTGSAPETNSLPVKIDQSLPREEAVEDKELGNGDLNPFSGTTEEEGEGEVEEIVEHLHSSLSVYSKVEPTPGTI